MSNTSKNKILIVLNLVFKEAQRQGLASDNPVALVGSYSGKSKARDIFTSEELKTMFPDDDEALLHIWGGPMWAAYFLTMRDTGHRPSEQAAFSWADYNDAKGGFVVSKACDKGSRSIRNRTKNGRARATLVSERTKAFIERWREKTPNRNDSGLIFLAKTKVLYYEPNLQ